MKKLLSTIMIVLFIFQLMPAKVQAATMLNLSVKIAGKTFVESGVAFSPTQL